MRNRRSLQKSLKFIFSWLPEQYNESCLITSRNGELFLFIEGEPYSLMSKIPRFCDSHSFCDYEINTNQFLCKLFSFVEQNEAVKGLISNDCLSIFSFNNKIEIPISQTEKKFPQIYETLLIAGVNELKSALYWVYSEGEEITSIEIQLGQLKLFSQTKDEEIGSLYKPFFSNYEFYTTIWRKNLEKLICFIESICLYKEKPKLLLLEDGIGINFKELSLLFKEPICHKNQCWFSQAKNEAKIQCLLVPSNKTIPGNFDSMNLTIENGLARLEAGSLTLIGESKPSVEKIEATLYCRNLISLFKGAEKLMLYINDDLWAIKRGNLFYTKKQAVLPS